ncbi:MAG: hypothetical protein M3Q14_00975 [bacterium]|nr:hypothetical protein [bacterium]
MEKKLDIQRFSGIVTVMILRVTILTSIYITHLDIFGSNPLSSVGTDNRTALIFSVGLISASLTLLFFTQYLSRVYIVSKSFLIILIVGQIGQIIAALVHFGGEQPDRAIHSYAALTLAFSIPLALWRFAAAQTDPSIRRRAYLLFWVELACFVIGIGVFSFVIKGAPIGQIITALAFHAWIIYFSLRRQI